MGDLAAIQGQAVAAIQGQAVAAIQGHSISACQKGYVTTSRSSTIASMSSSSRHHAIPGLVSDRCERAVWWVGQHQVAPALADHANKE